MERDLHFYGLAVLARAAGFTERQSLDIAYASQYVDDSTEGDGIPVGDDRLYDPVRTAHIGLKSFMWDVQKSIYIPFHFLPPDTLPATGGGYVTEAASALAHAVFERACGEPDERTRHIAIGIALHTFADTFSHEGFSGRFHIENDVDDIRHKDDGSWLHLVVDRVCQDYAMCIGHLQAGHDPDLPYLMWKCKRPANGAVAPEVGTDLSKRAFKSVTRDNSAIFMKACKAIYGLLEEAAGASAGDGRPGWSGIENGVAACLGLAKGLPARCQAWKKRFGALFPTQPFEYSKTAWRKEALCPDEPCDAAVDWDPSGRSQFARMRFDVTPEFWESRWVIFHRAALKQRHFVLERLL